jgi:hypothetical protein
MRKLIVSSAILVALCPITSNAQDRVIVDERPAVVVPAPAPGVTVERRGPAVEKRKVETTGRAGCDSKTVTRATPAGSTSVTKERC